MKSARSSAFFFLLSLSGCSVLFGQVKPIEEKSVNPVTRNRPDEAAGWIRLETVSSAQTHTDIPDAAWQSPTSSAVISINSVCRASGGEDLLGVTRSLLSQWDRLEVHSEKSVKAGGFPALETTASGAYSGQRRKFRILIVKSPTCTYDLVYVSPPESFDQELSVFERFRDNLVLK
jgi:hypothetical protein